MKNNSGLETILGAMAAILLLVTIALLILIGVTNG